MPTKVLSLDQLDGTAPSLPSIPTIVDDSDTAISDIVRAIVSAKRIVVVCGAGISVAAGIPDFRSPEGLFRSLKKDNPKESLSSGKDLFNASVFHSEQTTALFYKMIASLSSLSSAAQPTSFHTLLRMLDERGQLLRVYTQNIDTLEEKAGMSFGIPIWDAKVKVDGRGAGGGNKKRKGAAAAAAVKLPTPSSSSMSPEPGPSFVNPPPLTPTRAPRCIPLHGTLQNLHCSRCYYTIPLLSEVDTLADGTSIPCAQCTNLNDTRRLVGKRERGVGIMRPSVVLYGEDNNNGEGVGECVRRDLVGLGDVGQLEASSSSSPTSPTKGSAGASLRSRSSARPDLVIVAGTSLRVPGTNRIVREFAKAVRPPPRSPSPSPPSTSSPSKRRAAATSPGPRSIYLNLDFPLPARPWDGVFDVWVKGDVQHVSDLVKEGLQKQEKDEEEKARKAKVKSKAKKRTLESDEIIVIKAPAKGKKRKLDAVDVDLPTTPVKKKARTASSGGGAKRTKTASPLTPPSSGRKKPPNTSRTRKAAGSPKKPRSKAVSPRGKGMLSKPGLPSPPPSPTPGHHRRTPSLKAEVVLPLRKLHPFPPEESDEMLSRRMAHGLRSA